MIRPVISSPGRIFIPFRIWSIVIGGIHHKTDSQRRCVFFIHFSGPQKDSCDQFHSLRISGDLEFRPFSGNFSLSRENSRPRRPNPKKLAPARSWPVQFGSFPVLDTAAMPQRTCPKVLPDTMSATVSCSFSTSGSKIQNFFPHRNQVTHIDLLSCILLGCLNFQNLICPGKMSEKRMDRFPYLKINRTILDLKDHIICKHSVQRSKIVISRFCSVCLLVSPVLLAVVYKAPPDNSSSIRLYASASILAPSAWFLP